MSFCRLVVLPEDCYQDLKTYSSDKTTERPSESHDSETVEPTSQSEPTAEPTSEPKSEPSSELPSDPIIHKDEPVRSSSAPPDPIKDNDLPPTIQKLVKEYLTPAYKDLGTKLYKDLVASGLEIADSGKISIGGASFPEFGLGDLLRAACIVGHPGPIPLRVQEWLRAKMIQVPNQKTVIRPTWQTRYSFRRSTKAARQAHAEAPKLSTTKHKH